MSDFIISADIVADEEKFIKALKKAERAAKKALKKAEEEEKKITLKGAAGVFAAATASMGILEGAAKGLNVAFSSLNGDVQSTIDGIAALPMGIGPAVTALAEAGENVASIFGFETTKQTKQKAAISQELDNLLNERLLAGEKDPAKRAEMKIKQDAEARIAAVRNRVDMGTLEASMGQTFITNIQKLTDVQLETAKEQINEAKEQTKVLKEIAAKPTSAREAKYSLGIATPRI